MQYLCRRQTGARRQVFFVALNGFDTHANELATLTTLLGQLSPALKSFYDATVQLGIPDRVTTFTLSDFGRTFQPAAGGGSDHAWGNHHLILGGAVSERFAEFAPLLRSPAQLRAAHFAGQAGVVGAALAAAET